MRDEMRPLVSNVSSDGAKSGPQMTSLPNETTGIYIEKSDVRREDVLPGRGKKVLSHFGNVRFQGKVKVNQIQIFGFFIVKFEVWVINFRAFRRSILSFCNRKSILTNFEFIFSTALVDSSQQQYFRTTLDIEKKLIIQRIVFQIQESGGRFLLFDSQRQVYYPSGMEAARGKVAHALQCHRQRYNQQALLREDNFSLLTSDEHDKVHVKRKLNKPPASSPSSKKRSFHPTQSLESLIHASCLLLPPTEENLPENREDLEKSDPSQLQTMRCQVLILQHELEQARTVIHMLCMELKHAQMQNEQLKNQFWKNQ
jgi:hypothetical protein